jgi:hypothetical protein
LQAHIRIKFCFKKNEDINRYADNRKRPVPDDVFCSKVNAQNTGNYASSFERVLSTNPIKKSSCYQHKIKDKMMFIKKAIV